ncbi:hypothetical protein MTR67_017453 [Solanum verrucosum]|uniref:Uncharacterized protein n=1 Tax=Solanum verrucosum TaxID=315347 RepID=A0AAF0TRT4_SOLVR|nr:hypothetical protein MTR67_017453 [Solanum verrucosum]
MGDPSLIAPTENIGIKENLSYEEVPVPILDHQVRKMRPKEVASVKVQILSIQITLRSVPDLQFSSISGLAWGHL